MLRRLAELATRNVAFRRRLPNEFGSVPIWVSPGAGLRYLFRSMEDVDPALLRLARECVRPGHRVWDVGANLGLFAIATARVAGKDGQVVAIEPDTWLVELLRKSAAIQATDSARIEIVPKALANSVGQRELHIAQRSRATNYLAGYGSSQTGGFREVRVVETETLDALASRFPPPDVIKIDVEGAEREVLEGGEQMIAGRRPLIICEVSEPQSDWIGEFLRKRGYQMYDGDLPATDRRPLDRAPWNTLAIPA